MDKENVLKEFLLRNREAVMFTSLYEYDEEKHIKNEKKISYEDGDIYFFSLQIFDLRFEFSGFAFA